ncbi:MAG: outer membrane protein assembly factor BamA [Paludibacteraceae bacterium]
MFILFVIVYLPIYAQEGYEIKNIRFEGNKTFKKSDLLAQISMHETNLFQRLIQKKEPTFYSSEFAAKDLERIIRFYQSEGFLYVQVEVDTFNVDRKKNDISIRFTIDEGKPIFVDTIELNAQYKLNVNEDSLVNKLTKKFTLKKDARFNDLGLNQDIVEINNAFQNKGYAYSMIHYEVQVDTIKNNAKVDYYIIPGPLSRFGRTTIKGNSYVKESFIRRQLTYSEGDIYEALKLDKTRRNLYDVQTFRIISVIPQKDNNLMDEPIPVEILIEEMPRISSQFGVGYGTEDKFRAFVDFTYRGLLREAGRLNLYAKHSALEPYNLSLSLIQPQFLDKKTSLTINPYFRRQIEPGFDTQTLGLNVPFNRKFNEQFNVSLSYYYEKVTQRVEAGDYDVPDPESNKYLYNKSGLMAALSFNNGLPRFSPEKGFAAYMGFKYNGYIFYSDFNYSKLWVDLRKYNKIGDFVFSLRGMIGGIYSPDSLQFIPVEDRFYSGGANSIRGWSRSELGPKRDTGTPIGGKSIIEMSVEIRHQLFWKLEGAVFLDIGNVWTEAYHYKLNELAYAAGAGLRYNTPIGPIRLDLGFPLWNEKKRPQLFISIGQAF